MSSFKHSRQQVTNRIQSLRRISAWAAALLEGAEVDEVVPVEAEAARLSSILLPPPAPTPAKPPLLESELEPFIALDS